MPNSPTKLERWMARQEYGVIGRVSKQTGLCMRAIRNAAKGLRIQRRTALLLHEATNGEVPLEELLAQTEATAS